MPPRLRLQTNALPVFNEGSVTTQGLGRDQTIVPCQVSPTTKKKKKWSTRGRESPQRLCCNSVSVVNHWNV